MVTCMPLPPETDFLPWACLLWLKWFPWHFTTHWEEWEQIYNPFKTLKTFYSSTKYLRLFSKMFLCNYAVEKGIYGQMILRTPKLNRLIAVGFFRSHTQLPQIFRWLLISFNVKHKTPSCWVLHLTPSSLRRFIDLESLGIAYFFTCFNISSL